MHLHCSEEPEGQWIPRSEDAERDKGTRIGTEKNDINYVAEDFSYIQLHVPRLQYNFFLTFKLLCIYHSYPINPHMFVCPLPIFNSPGSILKISVFPHPLLEALYISPIVILK